MSEYTVEVNVAAWVEKVREQPIAYQRRQTVEITLNTIAMIAPLNRKLFLKGGLLMGLAYHSPRQTMDIDLTAALAPENNSDERIRRLLDETFPRAAAVLGYADLIVKTHSVKCRPKKPPFANAQFPALELKITSAKRGTSQEQTLKEGKTSFTIDVDISFNEPPLQQIQIMKLTGGQELFAYSLIDLVAEKYRAILQQIPRRRSRPQDIYDLSRLITQEKMDDGVQMKILAALKEKSRARRIEPTRDAFDEPEIRRRSGANWRSLTLEIDEVPEFDPCFLRVATFYRNLPWQNVP